MGADLDPITTSVAWVAGDDYFYFGHHVPGELAGNESLAGLLALAASGRSLPPDKCQVLDDIATTLTVADPRIWPLKIARLVSSYGGTMPAIAAATLWMEDGPVGFFRCGALAQMLMEWRAEAARSAPDDPSRALDGVLSSLYAAPKPAPPGFRVPLRAKDERTAVLRQCLHRRGRHELPWWAFYERATGILAGLRGLEPHVAVGVAAACLDLDLTPAEIAPLAQSLVHHTFVANAVEGARQAPRQLHHLPETSVRYAGPPPRTSPRAEAAIVPGSHQSADSLPRSGVAAPR